MPKKNKKWQTYVKEQQDAYGISRKKRKGKTIKIETFLLIKFLLVIAIPIFYFVYAPLLLPILILYVGLFFLARMAEMETNKSVIKANRIGIFKLDSALALILIIIALVGAIGSVSTKRHVGMFENSDRPAFAQMAQNRDFKKIKSNRFWKQVETFFVNWGSLLTGDRGLSSSSNKGKFGFEKPPEGFVSDKFKPTGDKMKFSMENVPVKYVLSSILSTVDTVLVFAVFRLRTSFAIGVVDKEKQIRNANERRYKRKSGRVFG